MSYFHHLVFPGSCPVWILNSSSIRFICIYLCEEHDVVLCYLTTRWNLIFKVNNLFFFQAIDPRTRMVLFKMLNRGVFNDINGCISTGKEVCITPLCFLFIYLFIYFGYIQIVTKYYFMLYDVSEVPMYLIFSIVFFPFKMQLNFFNLKLFFVYFLLQQANVYHATKSDGQELAIKIYKTSVLVFKYD